MKYTVKQFIGAGSCDPKGCLSLLGALTLVEDVVTVTLDKVHINGFQMRRNYGAVMVFSKNQVKFLETIKWNEKVTISCFVSSKSMARMNVDVCVKNQVGIIVMYARTEVCAVDINTGRIRRLDAVGIGDEVRVTRPLIEMEWTPLTGKGALVDTVKVRTGNIDYAGHTNNVEYVRLLLNTFTLDEWRGEIAPREIQVAYLSQSFLGDSLSIYCENRNLESNPSKERLYTIKKDAQDVLRCAIRW
ncbi:MAG: hypothetical protein IJ295_00230 [Clostridia bacterium]|nr:hypothetical protein [Clostridia bacterium]